MSKKMDILDYFEQDKHLMMELIDKTNFQFVGSCLTVFPNGQATAYFDVEAPIDQKDFFSLENYIKQEEFHMLFMHSKNGIDYYFCWPVSARIRASLRRNIYGLTPLSVLNIKSQ